MMREFGFQPILVKWVREMISMTSFLMAINGDLMGFLRGGRDIRQGDPLSSYLFTLVMK